MEMVFLSHVLIFIAIIVVLANYLSVAKNKHDATVWLEMAALLFMGGGCVIDLCRAVIIKVGDFGKFSRYGTTIYGLCMIFFHIKRIVRSEIKEAEKNKQNLEDEVARRSNRLQDMLG